MIIKKDNYGVCQFLIGNVQPDDGADERWQIIDSIACQFLIGNVQHYYEKSVNEETRDLCQFLIGNVQQEKYER